MPSVQPLAGEGLSGTPAAVPQLVGAQEAPSPSQGEGRGEGRPPEPAPELPPLTLDDVRALTADSDFSRFVAPRVAPEVKNAAVKKLFADPRYNVMDGMDVYIDDYSKPDPIGESVLRQLVSAKFLGLFAEEEKVAAAPMDEPALPRDDADNPEPQSVAESPMVPEAVTEMPSHADPDLRLQQDDAPAGEEPGDIAR